MRVVGRDISGSFLGRALRPGAFLAFLYLYLWLVVDPALAYHGYWLTMTFPVYRATWESAAERLAYPGGPAEYASALLSQFYRFSWLGALVICTVAGLVCLTTWGCLRALRGSAPRILHYGPALLFAVAYNQYRNPLAPALAALVATGCAWAYARVPVRMGVLRLAFFLALAVVAYYTAGGAFLIFAAVCGLFEAAAEKRWLAAAVCFVAGAALPYGIGGLALKLSPEDAYLRFWAFHLESDPLALGLLLALYLSWPVLASAAVASRLVGMRLKPVVSGWRFLRIAELLTEGLSGGSKRVFEAALPVGIAAVVLGLSFAKGTKALFEVEYYARHGDWEKVLAVAHRMRLEEYSLFVNWDVNRALCHTRRLPEEMFAYPQNVLGLLPTPPEFRKYRLPQPVWVKLSDVYFELGRVNEAEHMAYEALEFLGEHPVILRQLVLAAAVKGETETARVLLRMVGGDPLSGNWARGYLERLEEDPCLSWDPEVQRLRSLMVEQDTVGWLSSAEMLTQSLQRNDQNRMAFEYLMGHYLLNGDLEGVARNIGRLYDFGYTGIPRHYEEALLLYQRATGASPAPYGWSISDETYRRYREFSEVLDRYRAMPAAARDILAPVHGNSYFFYFTFGQSGAAR